VFGRFAERARRVVFFARYEASQFGSRTIESEHLLFGLILEDKNLPKRFLIPPPPKASAKRLKGDRRSAKKSQRRLIFLFRRSANEYSPTQRGSREAEPPSHEKGAFVAGHSA